MKKYLKALLLMAVAGCLTACSLDELPTENKPEEGGVGYLQIGGIEITGDTENSSIGDQPEFTRATTAAGDDYFIEIVEATKGLVWSGTYATVKSLNPASGDSSKKGIALEPGTYVVHAYQTQAKAPASDVAVDTPYYAGKSDQIVIEKNQTATATVTCRLANIRVTVELSADLVQLFKNYEDTASEYGEKRLMTLVEIGTETEKNEYTFEKTAKHPVPADNGTTTGGPIVYFKDVAGPNSELGNTMLIRMSGTYYTGDPVDIYGGGTVDNNKWKDVVMNKTITSVKAGQWRKISIDIDHNTTGDAEFVFTIENYVYDEEINVTTETFKTLLSYEESIPEDDVNDALAPQVSIDGNAEGVMTYTIDASKYDPDASTDATFAWKSHLKAIVTPQGTSKVQRLYAKLMNPESSTSLAAAMQNKGFVDGNGNYIISLYPTSTMTSGANQYVNVAEDGTKVTLTNDGMSALFKHPGTHVFRLATESDDSHSGFGDITITVSGGSLSGPVITWKANGVPAETLEVNNGTESATVSLSSRTGITALSVKIESDVLTESELATFQLALIMDIFNPATALMETRLRAFGFLPIENFDRTGKSQSEVATAAAKDDNYRIFDPTTGERKVDINGELVVSKLYMEKNISFDVSEFLALLADLECEDNEQYKSTNKFTIIASDESGNSEAAMTINVAR